MSKEAMKLALEALEHGLDYAKGEQFENAQRFKGYEHLAPDDAHSIQLIETAIKALEEALAQSRSDAKQEQRSVSKQLGEPVAWRREFEGDVSDLCQWLYADEYEPKDERPNWQPLYTHPQPKEEQVVSLQCAHCQVTIETLNDKVMSLLAKQEQGEPVAYPDKCPITRRDFFMLIEHPTLGLVPTYGGPFDSYTIPHMEGAADQLWHERELICHRFDHDEGYWMDDVMGVETIPMRVISEGALNELLDQKEDTTPQQKQEQGEPVACQSVSTEMLKFLNGEAPLDGVWFGENHPIEKGAYWWRKRLNTTPQQRKPLTDAPLYLSNLVNALDNAFISSWQSTHHWAKQLDEARDYLAAHGIKGEA